MKIKELLLESQTEQKGTYAAVQFDDDTCAALQQYITDNELPNGVPAKKMHCTVLYSRKPCPNFEPLGTIDPPWVGTPTGLEVWESKGKLRDQPSTRCLVLKFDCDELHDRHNTLMDEHDATYDFPEYKTHVTLSYDFGEMDETELPSITDTITSINIVNEYKDDLDLDWASTNKMKS